MFYSHTCDVGCPRRNVVRDHVGGSMSLEGNQLCIVELCKYVCIIIYSTMYKSIKLVHFAHIHICTLYIGNFVCLWQCEIEREIFKARP